MDTTRWERFAPLTGFVAVVLFVIGVVIEESGASRPDDGDPAALLAWFRDDTNTIIGAEFLFALGAVLLIWFFGSLRSTLRGAEGGSGRESLLARVQSSPLTTSSQSGNPHRSTAQPTGGITSNTA